MQRSIIVPLIVLTSTLVAGCGAAPPNPDAVRATLERMHVEHAAAYLREDLDEIMTLYTDDAVIRPNHAEPVRGRTAIREFIGGWFDAMDFQSLTYETDELSVHGDSVYVIGTFESEVVLAGTQRATDRGSYFVLFLVQPDGTLRSHRGVFNSSMPLPVP